MKLKKSLGQNFLKDIFFLDKIIASSQIDKTKEVIEIGPGDGALTELILQNSKHLRVFEIDERFSALLKKKYVNTNIKVFNEDFLDVDLNGIAIDQNIIMGNLPYNVSSQIIIKIIESNLRYQHCIFLIQKELANRFINSSKSSKISLCMTPAATARNISSFNSFTEPIQISSFPSSVLQIGNGIPQ